VNLGKKVGVVVAGSLVALIIVYLILAAIWRWTNSLSVSALAAWALVSSALIAPAFALGWASGHIEARGRLAGIDLAIDRVMGAILRTNKISTSAIRAPPARLTVVQPQLPSVELIEQTTGESVYL
jgi:hypothetical protein